jgi:hypothetical protein
MIAKFNTPASSPAGSTPGAQAKGGNGLIWFVVALGAAVLVYKYVIKPMREEQEEQL